MTTPPGDFTQPDQDVPGWRLWVSSTGRWWALRQTALTAAQVAAGCQPLIYASDRPALSVLISAQEEPSSGDQPSQPSLVATASRNAAIRRATGGVTISAN